MSTIIDLGNGYGMIEGYKSSSANLHFRLRPSYIRRFYLEGYLNRDEYYYWLSYLGYTSKQIDWLYALDSTPVSYRNQERR